MALFVDIEQKRMDRMERRTRVKAGELENLAKLYNAEARKGATIPWFALADRATALAFRIMRDEGAYPDHLHENPPVSDPPCFALCTTCADCKQEQDIDAGGFCKGPKSTTAVVKLDGLCKRVSVSDNVAHYGGPDDWDEHHMQAYCSRAGYYLA
jgi:hypothetical protein